MQLTKGQTLPDIELEALGGERSEISLMSPKNFNQQPCVLFFYPKNNTPG